ncbi:MAG: pyridoxal-phosphate dependent enzyme, partial [Deltaproteobacteria bacterium]|nr:pyridoxal-phosphate dependent enzyme [Deltaproteobacteria bacterium]
VVAVGGGGLLGGVLDGLDRVGWRKCRVLAVETEGASSFNRSLAAGRVVELDAITSVAKSLGARRVSDEVLARALARGVESHVVSDPDAIAAVVRFADDSRQLVEPACGAALAAVYDWRQGPTGSVLAIVCGGAGVTAGDLVRWRSGS